MQEPKKKYRRRIYFIEKKFQTKFIVRFCLLVIVASVLTGGLLYLLTARSTTVSIVDSRVVVRTTADFLLPLLVQTVIVATVVVGIASVFFTMVASHKIAGPVYRFKKVMQALGEGDFSRGFHIRQYDQLQELANDFNEMIGKVGGNLNVLKSNFSSLKEKLDSISENDVANDKRSALGDLKKAARDIEQALKFFKS
jgi:methyl-accepting chemotaxis protein